MDADQETQQQDAQRAHLSDLLEQHRANLADLELQASRFGLATPLEISNGIRYEKEQIRLYTDALASPLPPIALERLGPGGRTQIMVKRVDRLEALLTTREAFDQLAREQRQREVDALAALDRAERERRQREIDALAAVDRAEREQRQARQDRFFIEVRVIGYGLLAFLLIVVGLLIALLARG